MVQRGKVRILAFNKRFVSLSETFIYRQIDALKKDFKVDLMGFELLNTDNFNLEDYRFVRIPTYGRVVKRVNKLFRKYLAIDLIYACICFFIFRPYFKKNRAIVHAHYGWNGIYFLKYLKRRNIPLVVSFHGSDASAWLRKSYAPVELPALFDYASGIILCSNHMINALNLDDLRHKVYIVPYGIDINEFAPNPRRKPTDTITILHAGRLVAKKGVNDLIRVFSLLKKKYSNIFLQIIGDGCEIQRCRDTVRELDLEHSVKFFGGQPQPMVKEAMNACDIFVLNSRISPSGDMEGLPNAILEAMAFEKPVVSTFHAGIPMAIENERSGLLLEEYDNDALYNAIERLILDENLRIQLGKNARLRIKKLFTNDIMGKSLIDVFTQIRVS